MLRHNVKRYLGQSENWVLTDLKFIYISIAGSAHLQCFTLSNIYRTSDVSRVLSIRLLCHENCLCDLA